MSHLRGGMGSEVGVYFSPRGGCQEAIIREINQAKATIDVAMYYFTSWPLAEALIEAERRGVEVRVYLDESQDGYKYSKAKEISDSGAEVRFEDHPGKMHNKFAVIDGKVLIAGSYNWTKAAEEKNDENVLVIRDEVLTEVFGKKFEEYWGVAKKLLILPQH